ncbi:MAG: M23 family metallopeptidase [Treponema sp.]|jgi:murein DD-endopeptidase MepM/ murein hydrolase activator NlpD|nr:M23 family metallopeptidase [Treponema sp.]
MAAIIEKQFIEKRHKSSPSGLFSKNGHTNKSAGFNSGFMSQFDQNPAHIKRKKPFRRSAQKLPLFKLFNGIKIKRPAASNQRAEKKTRKVNESGGLSFPVPSIATLAAAAGTVVIALGALNWENIDFGTPDILAFHPAEDEAVEQRIIEYATTGVPGLSAGNIENLKALEKDNELLVEIDGVKINLEHENPHGMLVTFEWQQYRVKRGDTVSGIAQNFGVSVGAIIASNEISNARRLQEGANIRIPNIDGIPYQIQKGDSLSKISASFNVPLEVILDVNDIQSDIINQGETIFIPGARMNDIDLRLSLGDLFMYPLSSRYITSNYGMRKDPISGALQFHAGVDFRASTGTAVLASFDGTVAMVSENWLYGKYIIINHTNGYKSLYGHLSAFSVKQGDKVIRGRKIGEVGNTGYSTGPHLHFGIYDRNNKLVNPLELLN